MFAFLSWNSIVTSHKSYNHNQQQPKILQRNIEPARLAKQPSEYENHSGQIRKYNMLS
jgi:hypothetical protein